MESVGRNEIKQGGGTDGRNQWKNKSSGGKLVERRSRKVSEVAYLGGAGLPRRRFVVVRQGPTQAFRPDASGRKSGGGGGGRSVGGVGDRRQRLGDVVGRRRRRRVVGGPRRRRRRRREAGRGRHQPPDWKCHFNTEHVQQLIDGRFRCRQGTPEENATHKKIVDKEIEWDLVLQCSLQSNWL